MKNLIIGLMISTVFTTPTVTQKLTLIKATSQGWSGGAYGRGGCKYFIQIKYGEKVTLDSVYINKTGYALSPNINGAGGFYTDSIKHIYNISESESHNWARNYNYDPDEDNYKVKVEKKTPPPPLPVRHFEGAALVVYYYKGKKDFLVIGSFTELPSIAYP